MILRGLIPLKNMLNSTISMSYPDVVIACIERQVSLEAFRAIEGVGGDITMQLFPGGWLITITANHSNYLVCDRANTQSVTVRKVVKLQLNYCNALVIKWIYNIVLFGGKNAGCSFFITFNWCICSLFPAARKSTPASKNQWPRLRNSRTLFCSRAMLICSIIWLGKRMLRVVVLRVLFFVDMRLPRIQRCRWFVLSEVVFTLSWCRSINTIPAS